MLALGGRLFNNPSHINIGRKITDGCVWAYSHGPHGVMPEIATFAPCSTTKTGGADCIWKEEKLSAQNSSNIRDKDDEEEENKHIPPSPGYISIPDARYILRPEAIESVFILYRITGSKNYLDDAWDMWTAIKNITNTTLANAAINNLLKDDDSKGMPEKQDRMESFWLAETLKYFYLI